MFKKKNGKNRGGDNNEGGDGDNKNVRAANDAVHIARTKHERKQAGVPLTVKTEKSKPKPKSPKKSRSLGNQSSHLEFVHGGRDGHKNGSGGGDIGHNGKGGDGGSGGNNIDKRSGGAGFGFHDCGYHYELKFLYMVLPEASCSDEYKNLVPMGNTNSNITHPDSSLKSRCVGKRKKIMEDKKNQEAN